MIFNEAALKNNNEFDENSTIIHFTNSIDKQKTVSKKLNSIHSNNLNLGQMHPGGGYHYFW